MKALFVKIVLSLILLLGLTFGIHLTALHHLERPLLDNNIVLSYLLNGLLAAGILGILFVFKERFKMQLGFLFIAGSFFKFLIFFTVFYPLYKADGNMEKIEFFTFFVPYLISLLIETVGAAQLLKKIG
ncbi:hypothetical protein ACFQ1M_12830 [Sungkyunkwania multivorans]|uniref:Uncharacterized protein n=1 Tax=Sungkyunkwania multivorans TaxID=1173618 RepID=A0ABW3D1A6_9FLAO